MTYNLQAVAAMDDPEHATGKTLERHRQPREAVAALLLDRGFDGEAEEFADEIVATIKRAGFSILQRV